MGLSTPKRVDPNWVLSDDGIWVPPLYPKQMRVFNSRARYLLLSGPRLSGKTTPALHKLVRHAWDVNGARIAMYSKFTKNATSAGGWKKIIAETLPRWKEDGVAGPYGAFDYFVHRPEATTRLQRITVRNYWGTESEIQLHSLKHDSEIEDRLLESEYSMIYFAELQNFEDPRVFSVSMAQLRLGGNVNYEDHIWMSDTNPPESGPNHFAYKLWFVDAKRSDHPDPEMQKKFELIQFTVDDNKSPDAQKAIEDLKYSLRHDPEATDRFINGLWTHGSGHSSKHFSFLFRRHLHVVGSLEEETYLNPSEKCETLVTGWDTGDVNHAFYILEKIVGLEGIITWHVLDELVTVNDGMNLEEFAGGAIEKIRQMEKLVGHAVEWRHWADTSLWRPNRSGQDPMDSAVITRLSEGEIELSPAHHAKAPGSVQKRVELVKQLLREERIAVSAHCTYAITMFENLRKGKSRNPGQTTHNFIQEGQDEKHSFDALTYPLYSEQLEDFGDAVPSQLIGRRMVSVSF